jgi:F-type H+-transporting ATPase subunit alpha
MRVSIGRKKTTLAKFIQTLEEHRTLEYPTIVVASASDNPADQYIAPSAGCAMREWLTQNGMDALIVYDDLSKHAVAYRQIPLVLKRPAGGKRFWGMCFTCTPAYLRALLGWMTPTAADP